MNEIQSHQFDYNSVDKPTAEFLQKKESNMREIVGKVFESIKYQCRPDKDEDPLRTFVDVFDAFMNGEVSKPKCNFVGGMNDKRNTLHENLFHALYPSLKTQVHFGTGKGGLEKYLSKRFTADFYDEESNIIYEIDGSSHRNELQILKDKIRDYFFYHELGIKTVRFTNEEVEQLVIKRLEELYEAGVLNV